MFLKPFRVKTQSSVKGSDRKKLRAELQRQYHIETSLLTQIIPNKDEMTVTKLCTHSEETPLVYNVSGIPVVFEVMNKLYPTVYTLWKYPDLLPTFTTWPPVLKKIQGGADLMLPGVVVKGPVTPHTFGKLKKGDSCTVKIVGNKAPIAIGTTGMSAGDMYESAMRGKGVIVVHSYKDHLWAMGDKSDPPLIEDLEMMAAADDVTDDSDDDDEGSEGASNQPEDFDGESEEVNDTTKAADGLQKLSLDNCQGATSRSEEDEDDQEEEDDDPRSPQERMDDLLGWCFLCALKTRVKKSDLPLLTSTFFRNHVQPCCPSGKVVDVKKSTYKKLSKFLQAMQKRGLIKVKELTKGVESIIEVTRDHDDLREFTAPDPSPTEDTSEPSGGGGGASNDFVAPVITEIYIVTAGAAGLFRQCGLSKGSALTAPEVRHCLTNYVKETGLTAPQGCIRLDPALSDLLLTKAEYHETLRWEDVMTRALAKLSIAHRLTFPGHQPVIKKGRLEPISMSTAQRGGNKKVTLIHNVELFGISPEELAHHIQIGRACSASVSERPGKNQGPEVLVQGNQIHYVAELLLNKYKIPRKFLSGLENAPKGKKKR